MTLLYDLRHEAVEQRHNQRVDVRAIDIGIGHNDNLVVAQLVDVGLAVALAVYAKTHADALDDVHHRLSFEDAVPLHLLHVQNLSAQRQDGLEVTVATLLGRATCGVSLDKEDLTLLRILVGTVGKFARQSTSRHRVLALHALTSLAGCDTGCGSEYHLVADKLGLLRVFLQIVAQSLAYGLLNSSGYL